MNVQILSVVLYRASNTYCAQILRLKWWTTQLVYCQRSTCIWSVNSKFSILGQFILIYKSYGNINQTQFFCNKVFQFILNRVNTGNRGNLEYNCFWHLVMSEIRMPNPLLLLLFDLNLTYYFLYSVFQGVYTRRSSLSCFSQVDVFMVKVTWNSSDRGRLERDNILVSLFPQIASMKMK